MSDSRSDCGAIQGYIDPNFPNPNGPDDACIIIYGYTPSLALCVLALVLFFIALLGHVWLLIRYRTWYFVTIVVALVFELVGYIARTLSSQKDPYLVNYFVIQYFFIVVAPVLISTAIYTLISITIDRLGPQYSPPLLSSKSILWLFITCDVVATIVQITGAALVGSSYSNGRDPTTANDVLLADLAFQVFSFALFIVLFATLVWRARNVASFPQLKPFFLAVFVATVAVYIRTCFRLAETAEGLLQFLSTHEVFFGCLEFLPIIVAAYVFLYWHPGAWLGSKTSPGKMAVHGDDSRAEQQQQQQQRSEKTVVR